LSLSLYLVVLEVLVQLLRKSTTSWSRDLGARRPGATGPELALSFIIQLPVSSPRLCAGFCCCFCWLCVFVCFFKCVLVAKANDKPITPPRNQRDYPLPPAPCAALAGLGVSPIATGRELEKRRRLMQEQGQGMTMKDTRPRRCTLSPAPPPALDPPLPGLRVIAARPTPCDPRRVAHGPLAPSARPSAHLAAIDPHEVDVE